MGDMITSEKQDWNCNSCSYYYAGNLYLSVLLKLFPDRADIWKNVCNCRDFFVDYVIGSLLSGIYL